MELKVDITFVYQLIIFLSLVFLLNTLLFQPILRVIEARRKGTSGEREEIEKLKQQSEVKSALYEGRLDEVKKEGLELRDKLKKEGEQEAAKIVDQARQQAEQNQKKLEEQISNESAKAKQWLQNEKAILSKQLAEKVLGRTLQVAFLLLLPATLFASSGEAHEEFNPTVQILYPYINFSILLVLLFVLLKKPAKEFFMSRSKEIAASLDQAAHEKQEALAKFQQQEARLQGLDKDIEVLRESFKQQGELAKNKLMEDAKLNAKSVLEISNRMGDQELIKVKEQLRDEAVELLAADAKELVKSKFDAQDQSKLIQSSVARLEVLQ